MTWYAWTTIKNGKDDELEVINPGDTVTQKGLSVDDDEWATLIESRAVRESKYPDIPPGYTGSPRDYVLEQRKAELADIDDLEDALAAATVEANQEADAVVGTRAEEAPAESEE